MWRSCLCGASYCITVRLYEHCSQTGLHGQERQMIEKGKQCVLFNLTDNYLPVAKIGMSQ